MSRDYAKYRGDHEHGGSSVKIFLSHAGADAADARRLADKLWDRLRRNSPDVAVFCTSQPEDRMPDPLLSIRPGQNFEMEARAAIERLRDYLRENIVTSQAYLVLVTRRSLEESRPWVRWEIFEAQSPEYRAYVVGGNIGKRVSIEAATSFGWHKWIGPDGIYINMETFGESAPMGDLATEFGFTVEAILNRLLT